MRWLLRDLRRFLIRARSGSVYIVARAGKGELPKINTEMIYWNYRTKTLRYTLIGRPYLAIRQLAKKLLSR